MIKIKGIIFSLLTASVLLTGCGGDTASDTINKPVDNSTPEDKKLAKAQLGVLANATVKIEELGVVPYKNLSLHK